MYLQHYQMINRSCTYNFIIIGIKGNPNIFLKLFKKGPVSLLIFTPLEDFIDFILLATHENL